MVLKILRIATENTRVSNFFLMFADESAGILIRNSELFGLDSEKIVPLLKISWALFPEKNWGGPPMVFT